MTSQTGVTRRLVLLSTAPVPTFLWGNVARCVLLRRLSMRRGEDQPPHKADPGLRAPRVVRGLQDRQDLNLTSDLSWDKLNNKLERRGPHPTLSLTCRHKLDRLDLEDLQVCEDHLDLKGSWDRRETPETRDLPAPPDCKASPACLG